LKQTKLFFFSVLNTGSEGRVIGGHDAAQNEFPYAGIMIAGGVMCSCTLVRFQWVLLAGHCVGWMEVGKDSGSVWFGDPVRHGPGEVRRDFVEWYVHPNYTGGGSYDIALLHLTSAYQFSNSIHPINVPFSELKLLRNRRNFSNFFF
jgi:Trypsin